ncbi:MAG TPA: MlaD family protein [Mucilaginibacter sp.]|nr:MlaD family protein [Mucilaginibacter sp.]
MKISNETKIGVLTTIAIAILILCYSYLRGNDVFSATNRFYAVYNSVEGLSVSKPVLVNGFQIGHVSNMKLRPDGRTVVEFKIEPQYNVPDNTLAKLVSTDLLGSKAIVFEMGNSKNYAEDKDTLKADVQGSLAESLQPIQKKAEDLIAKLDSSLQSINKIMNPDFQKNVDRSFLSIANSLQTLEGTTKKIDQLIGSQTGHINAILSNAESTSSNLKTSTSHLDSIAGNVQKFSRDLSNSNLKQTFENANKAIADLQAAVAKINNGQGSLSLLINDKQLYENLNSSSKHLDSLLIDLKAHPKRYVSFSVFGGGKKNK